ncbi:heavy-metal-associated domain-containing protein [Longimicrobium terrae]|uniref:Copper chaperone n=1 Tax=Longimicrobium terrae TaxID=1639882 RepID=A0A841GZT7_9BACT|nr:cation transporter [Longimicrobium terrae]MBB4636812.1 copper chaperone [Longimicrobium terrae]MBB6071189.1 copper chaperone [Longimicrobium terrae]NNC29237.1 heavy-metal-associated domain-containing protein [Longimicrobium terrae]
MQSLSIEIEGMTCGHCVAAVRGALAGMQGVRVEEVKIGSARVEYDPAAVQPEQIAEAVRDEGYAAHPAAA